MGSDFTPSPPSLQEQEALETSPAAHIVYPREALVAAGCPSDGSQIPPESQAGPELLAACRAKVRFIHFDSF